jgi:hypothetical protein
MESLLERDILFDVFKVSGGYNVSVAHKKSVVAEDRISIGDNGLL